MEAGAPSPYSISRSATRKGGMYSGGAEAASGGASSRRAVSTGKVRGGSTSVTSGPAAGWRPRSTGRPASPAAALPPRARARQAPEAEAERDRGRHPRLRLDGPERQREALEPCTSRRWLEVAKISGGSRRTTSSSGSTIRPSGSRRAPSPPSPPERDEETDPPPRPSSPRPRPPRAEHHGAVGTSRWPGSSRLAPSRSGGNGEGPRRGADRRCGRTGMDTTSSTRSAPSRRAPPEMGGIAVECEYGPAGPHSGTGAAGVAPGISGNPARRTGSRAGSAAAGRRRVHPDATERRRRRARGGAYRPEREHEQGHAEELEQRTRAGIPRPPPRRRRDTAAPSPPRRPCRWRRPARRGPRRAAPRCRWPRRCSPAGSTSRPAACTRTAGRRERAPPRQRKIGDGRQHEERHRRHRVQRPGPPPSG